MPSVDQMRLEISKRYSPRYAKSIPEHQVLNIYRSVMNQHAKKLKEKANRKEVVRV